MTATKKKQQSKPGGTLMGMRSGFQKAVGTGASNKKKAAAPPKWTFQKVFTIVAAGALLIALFYAFSQR